MPGTGVVFDGIDNADNLAIQGFRLSPPDPTIAVGPDHIVETVNLLFQIFDKTGSSLYGPAKTSALWSGFGGICETTDSGDPIALYDELADRFFVSQFAFTSLAGPHHMCIAISTAGDPTGTWYRYDFTTSATELPDYPKFGVWPDGYYMSANEFDGSGTSYSGVLVAAFDRDAMLNGDPATMISFDLGDTYPLYYAMLPSDLDGPAPPAGAPNVFMEVDDAAVFGDAADTMRLFEFHVDWTTPGDSTFGSSLLPSSTLAVDDFDPICPVTRDCIPQPGVTSSSYLDDLGGYLMYRLQYRNFGTHETMVVNHTVDTDASGGTMAGIRWYEFRNEGYGWFINQQGTYGPGDGLYRWLASAAMDSAGDIGMVFTVSNSSTYPTIRYAGRLPSDAAGVLGQGEATLRTGLGSQTSTSSRWGDYAMTAVDPSDDCTLWMVHEYLTATDTVGWTTTIGSTSFPNCPDSSAPTGAGLTKPAAPFMKKKLFTVEWGGASDDSGALAGYDVDRRIAPWNADFGSYSAFADAVDAGAATVSGSVGKTYCYRAYAFDNAGNLSAPSSPDTCTAIPLNDDRLTATGSWTRRNRAGYYLGDYSESTQMGDFLKLTGVRATRLAVVVTKGPGYGKLRVWWNGVAIRTIDLSNATVKKKQIVLLPAFGSAETGTVKLEVATDGKIVRVEGFGVSHA